MARLEVYPKLVVEVETTLTEEQLRQAIDAIFPDLKDRLRRFFRTNAQVQIVGWHYHLTTGPVDETE